VLLVLCLLGVCVCVSLSVCHIFVFLVEFASDRNCRVFIQTYYMIFLYEGTNFLF